MATYTKPASRHTISDWFTNCYALSMNAERERFASHETRQESRLLRNEVDNRTKWDQLDNNTRLSDRIAFINRLTDQLQITLDSLNHEIDGLSAAKDQIDYRMEDINLANHINVENLVLREGRQVTDLVEDYVEEQLLKERDTLACIKKQLQCKIDEAFEHLCVLQEMRQAVSTNIMNKRITTDIDVDQYNITDESAGVTFKPDPTKNPPGLRTVKEWEDFCIYEQARADTEIATSVRMREAILQLLEQTENDLCSQHTNTEYSLRRRLHNYDMTLDELNWQKTLTETEMAEMEQDIIRLEDSVRDKQRCLKICHTRLENRSQRPGEEMCSDNVHFGLVDEVKQINATIEALKDKMRETKHALDCMEMNLHTLNQEIMYKLNSKHIDQQCLDSRKKLQKRKRLSVSERNMQLTGISREKTQLLPF